MQNSELGKLKNHQEPADTQSKIEKIKQFTYPKKRKPVLQTQSFRSLPNKKTIVKIQIKSKKNNQNPQNLQRNTISYPILKNESKLQLLKKTTLEFNENSPEKKKQSIHASPWTLQNWMPGNSSTTLLKRRFYEPRESRNLFAQSQNPQRMAMTQRKSLSKALAKDPQNLLRKNSLYLLNFIRTRQRRNTKDQLKAEFPLVSQKIKHQQDNLHFQRPTRIQRERVYLQTLKNMKQQQKQQKIVHLIESKIYPEPW